MTVFQNISPPINSFGELESGNKTAFIQNSATYNLLPANFRQYSTLSGSSEVSDNLFKVSTGTTTFAYSAIQSFRSINNKAGQSSECILNAIFPSNVANSWTGAGFVNLSDELSFGYNGTIFGIWHRYRGQAEVRLITVTGASSGSTNLTLTLNTVAYTIPLTAGTTAHNASQIAAWLNANQSIWVADQIDNTVIVSAESDGAKSGTYSYSHATSTGTVAQSKAGVTKTSTHIPQSEWSENKMEDLNPAYGNCYKIQMQDSGFGNTYFYVMSKESGRFILVHIIKYLNSYSTVNLAQSSLRFGMYVASTGSTANVSVHVASVAMFVSGNVSKTRNPRGVKNTQTITNSAFTNILTIKNRRTYNGIYNQIETTLLNLNISSEAGKNVEIEVRGNSTFSAGTNYSSAGTNLITDVDITANTVTSGTLLAAFTVQANGSRDVDLEKLAIRVPPSLYITISAKITSGASAPVTATLTYYEDL
jgi:hypothetical protein